MSLADKITALAQAVGAKVKQVQTAIPAAGTAAPSRNGNPSAGVASTYARSDHVHPSDVGSVIFVPGTVALPGTIKLNGATLSRTSYAALYAYAASSGLMAATEAGKTIAQFGPGDGSTTFSLPDYRGYFPRFWDDGKGVDSGRMVGGAQSAYAGNITASIQDRGFGSGTAYNAMWGLTIQGHAWAVSGLGSNAAATVDVTPGDARPVNVALLACIKY